MTPKRSAIRIKKSSNLPWCRRWKRATRNGIIDSLRYAIVDEVLAEDSTLVGQVDAYYGGNEFWLSVYQDYNDPSSYFHQQFYHYKELMDH